MCLLMRIVFAVQSTDSHKYFQIKNTVQYFQYVFLIKLIYRAWKSVFSFTAKSFHVCESKTDFHCILNWFLKLKIIIMYALHIILVSVIYFLLGLC